MSFENLALLSRRDRIRLAVLVVILMTVALWASILLGDGRLKMKDQAWVWGGNLGSLYEFTPSTRVGLTWTSQVNLNLNASAEFSGLAPAVSAALARVGLLDASIKLGIKVPQQAMASLFTQIDDRWALLGSVGWQQWSKYGQVRVGVDDATNPRSLTTDIPFNTGILFFGA